MASRSYRHTKSSMSRNSTTPVTLTWDSTLGAYNLKFGNTHQWDKMQGVIIWIKQTIPSNERDYDPDTRIWAIHEKHIPVLKQLLELMPEFDLTFVEKPEYSASDGQSYQTEFVPIETYKKRFKDLTGEELNEQDYKASKHIYRRACMIMHPDRNPGNASMASKMADLNEAWFNLEVKLFKVKEFAKQEA